MEIVFQNFGRSILILIWIICGIVAYKRDPEVLWFPAIATLIYFWR